MNPVIFFLGFAMILVEASAQDVAPAGAPVLSDGPIVAKVGNFDAWEIDFTYSNKDDLPSEADATASAVNSVPVDVFLAKTRRVILTRTKPIWHVEITKSKGGKIDQWGDGADQFLDTPATGAYLNHQLAAQGSYTGSPIQFEDGDFPDMEWLSKKNYIGVQTVGGQKCFTFSEGDKMAWINLETKFPIAWRRGQETRVFKQLPPPSTTLQLPASIIKIKDALNADLKRLTTPYRPRG